METGTPNADFGRLMQYGAVGVIAALLLVLVVGIFRQLINHALEQNKELQRQHRESEAAHVLALNAMAQELRAMRSEFVKDFGMLYNEVSSITEGSRAHRGPRRGGGHGGSGGGIVGG